jgi:hypothetical protein
MNRGIGQNQSQELLDLANDQGDAQEAATNLLEAFCHAAAQLGLGQDEAADIAGSMVRIYPGWGQPLGAVA